VRAAGLKLNIADRAQVRFDVGLHSVL